MPSRIARNEPQKLYFAANLDSSLITFRHAQDDRVCMLAELKTRVLACVVVRLNVRGHPRSYLSEHILELRFLQSMSLREAARIMGVSVGNAKVLQHRALRLAAKHMEGIEK